MASPSARTDSACSVMLPPMFCIDTLLSMTASITGVTVVVACAPCTAAKPPEPAKAFDLAVLIATARTSKLPARRICAPWFT